MPIRKTHEQYVLDVQAVHGTALVVLDDYEKSTVKIRHKCKSCNHVWATTPNSVLSGNGCPECAREKMAEARRHTTDSFKLKLRKLYGSKIQLMGEYRSGRSLRFKCYTCLNTFKHQHILERVVGCPSCAGKIKQRNAKSYKRKDCIAEDGTRARLQGYEPQALNWILNKYKTLKAADIVFDESGEVPSFRYKVGRRSRWYYPDMFIPSKNRIIEVKSMYTLGLTSNRGWRKNQEKAKACLAAGYKFVLMLMQQNGDRIWLPKDWYLKTKRQVLTEMAFHNGIHTEEQYNDFRQEKEKKARFS